LSIATDVLKQYTVCTTQQKAEMIFRVLLVLRSSVVFTCHNRQTEYMVYLYGIWHHWRHSSVVRKSVFGGQTFPDPRPIYG